jgi:hypothetical protein
MEHSRCASDSYSSEGSGNAKKKKDEELKGLKERTGGKILQNVGAFLDSQALSDLKIKTSDGKLFQAHKFILAGSVCIFSSHHIITIDYYLLII